jgi:alpha-N-acetylglucosamine transferase
MNKTKKNRSTSKTKSFKTKLTRIKSTKSSKSKYCCPDRKNKTQCSKLSQDLNINANKKSNNKNPKYAIMTLLFGNDSYLPGILLLGSSIRKVMPTTNTNSNKKLNIELCCMITNDISQEARTLILKIYDQVIDVDYLQIPPNLIKHKNPSTRNIYSKTFTKLRIFEMTQYDKILFLDADMLVIKEDIFSLFALQTPSAIFMGKLSNDPTERYFKNEKALDKFKNKYCNWKGTSKELHGNLIPYDNYENERLSNGMNIESSVLLITPNLLIAKQRDNYLKNIRDKNIKMSGDTEMISRMFKNKIYAIEPRFFGRWVNPEEHPELVVLDLYGSDGKPWDISKFDELLKYIEVGDISYWWKMYMKIYEKEYKKYNNSMLDVLYDRIRKIVLQ